MMKNKFLNAFVIAIILFQAVAPIGALAYVGTDQEDYQPGSVVTIYGDNSNGAGYLPGESVHVEVWGPNDYQVNCDPDPVVAEDGSWSCQVTLWNDWRADGRYYYFATGLQSGVREDGTFTDAIAFGTAQTAMTLPGGNASTTLKIDKPTSTAAGHFLLAQITVEKGSDVTITPPTDWNLVLRTNNGTDLGQAIYYKFAGTSEPADYTWSFSQAVKAAGGIGRYTGVDTASPIVTSSGNTGTSNPLTALSVNGTTNSMLVALFGVKKNTTLSNPTGMTFRYSRQNPHDVSIRATDELRTSAGATGNRTSNAASVDKWVAQLVALREAVVCTAPSVSTQPSNQSITYGDNAVFTAAATGTIPSLKWQQSTDGGANWNDIPGATSSPLTVNTPGVSQSGTQYRAVFTNGCGTATSNAATLTVSPRSVTVTADAQGKAYGDADPALTYQVTSGSLVGGDSFSGALTRIAGEDIGMYAIQQGTLALNSNYNLTFVGADLTIGQRAVTVTADSTSKSYGDADPVLTYQITSGSLAAGDNFSGTLSRAAGENVGSYAISQGSLALNGNYNLSFVGANFTINQRAITVTADAQSKTYGDADPALTYQITSGSLAVGDSFSGALTRAAGEDVGTYAITQGTLALNSNYNLTFIGANLSITQATLTVTADNQQITYGDADPEFTFEYSGFKGSDTAAVLDTAPTCGVANPHGDAGSYAITCSGGAATNYSFNYVNGTLTVDQAILTVTADDQSINYGDSDPVFTFQYDGFKPGDDGTDVNTAPTCSVIDPHSNAGEYDITCSGGLDNNYAFAYLDGTLIIGKALLTVTADDQIITYGDSEPVFTFQYSGFLYSDVAGDVDTAPICDVAGAHTNAGSYIISCSGADDNNYTFAYVDGELTVDQASLTITAEDTNKTYGDANPVFTASYDGFVNGDDESDLDTPVSLSTSADTSSPVGDYEITASSAADSNYTIAFVNGTLTIGYRALTITADDQNKTYGSAFTFNGTEFTSDGLVNGDTVDTVALSSDGAAAAATVSSYDIVASNAVGSGLSNYIINYVNGTLTVTQAALTITADDKSKTYGDANPTFTASYDGFVNGDTPADLDTPVSLNTLADASSPVGDYEITASGAADDNYIITFVNGTLTIDARLVTVTADPQTKVYGESDPALTYQITSGNLVNGDTFSGALARETGEDVGDYPITQGDLALSSNYALTYIGADLTITERPITVTANAKTKVYGESDPALTYQISDGSLAFGDDFTGVLTRDSGEDVGAYLITQGTLVLSSNYALTFVGANLSITERPIAVKADDQSKTYGDADPDLTYSITAGSLAFDDAFTGALTRDAGEDVGDYAITQGSLALNSNYILTFEDGTLTINKKSASVTPDAASKIYGDADPAFTGTLSGFLPEDGVTAAYSRTSGETVTDSPYVISAVLSPESALDNYDITYNTADFTINTRSIEVTANSKTKVYGNADPALTYQITNGSLAFSDTFVGELDREPGEDVGAYAINQGTLALNDNYDLTYIGANLDITRRPVEVTADPQTKVYGDVDPELTYQISSGSLAFSDTFSGALSRAAGEAVGTYAITQGTLDLGDNYDLTYLGADLMITHRPVEVTADTQTKVYGNADPALTHQITSGSLAFTDNFTGSLTRATGENVGTYAITQGTLALNSNYNLTFVGADLSITHRPVEVTADTQTKVYGNADPALTYQITSGSLAFSDAFSGALSRVAGENVGTYAIHQNTLALNSNYALTYVGANLSITKATLTVTADNQAKLFGDPDPAFTFNYAGFKFTDNAGMIDTPPTCGVSGPHTAVGTYPIVCSGGMDNNYDFSYVNGTLTIGAWTLKGFYQPVDMNGVWNTVKNGSTVPLKFEIFAGSTELTNISAVLSVQAYQVACSASSGEDAIETVSTGGTSLRYDATSGQFIFNWQTPKKAGNCFKVVMTAQDGTSLTAFFKLK